MRDFIETKASQCGFADPAEFVVELVRACQAGDSVDQKLLEAVEGNSFEEITPEFWQRLRNRIPADRDLQDAG